MQGLSQKSLADAIGSTIHYVRSYESGRLEPSRAQVFRIAMTCGVSKDYFYRLRNELQQVIVCSTRDFYKEC